MKESKVNKDNFVVIQGWMLSNLKLKGNSLLIYAIIYGFSQAENQVYNGSLQYLADWTNSTKQGVSKVLKKLCEDGYLIKHEKIINGVKFCEYYATKFNGGMQQSLIPSKQSLIGGMQQSLHNNIESNKENKISNNIDIYNQEFEELWLLYKRKVNKKNSLKAYIKARQGYRDKDIKYHSCDYETIKDGVHRYNRYLEANETEEQFIKHFSTWLNSREWESDYTINQASYKSCRKEVIPDWIEEDKEPQITNDTDVKERALALQLKLGTITQEQYDENIKKLDKSINEEFNKLFEELKNGTL